MTRVRPSRRVLMYGLVAAQLLVLAAIVAPHELNMALDKGPTVDVEILQAHGAKDPFRGAYVSGQSALDLEASHAPLPAGLRDGDRVLVVFALDRGRRPRIIAVERERVVKPFTATSFTIPGRVVDHRERTSGAARHKRVRVFVGKPAVTIDLDLPASISVDQPALAQLSGPSIVRASLHSGFLGHRYFTDVRLAGRQWPMDVRFAYDDRRERLVVLAPRQTEYRAGGSDGPVRTDLFAFDSAGKELGAVDVPGRVVDGAVEPDGRLLALVAQERWSSEVALVRIDDAGQVLQRSAPIALDRVLGFDAASGSIWTLGAATSGRSQPPHFVQRTSFDGLREPRLGPFDSVPRTILSVGESIWVLETQRHRVTRFDATSGRLLREYRELNDPVELALDGRTLYVIEASRTQLTRIAEDGRIEWRIPRFQGLTWAVPDPGTGGGWVGASMFEGTTAGVLRFELNGAVTRLPVGERPASRGDWQRRVGSDVVRSTRDGRLLFRAAEAIAILSADGTTVTRVIGFRFPAERRLRS